MPSLSPRSHVDVLILGAGPAGLSLGHELQRRGVSFLLLEQGHAVGESWQRMPTHLKLVSPWSTNSLPGTASGLFPRHHQIGRADYHRYLVDYASELKLPVRTGVRVEDVSRNAEQLFCTRTSHGVFSSRLVVNATGCFARPFIPGFPGAGDSEIPQRHVAGYRDANHVKTLLNGKSGPILIVGKRLSAGQTMLELVDAGFQVAISHRSPIEFGPGPLAMWFFLRVFPAIEALKLRLSGSRATDWDVKMSGGQTRRLIATRQVRTFPAIQHFEKAAVVFANGARLEPAMVIYATGFRPALDHLHSLLPELTRDQSTPALRDMESIRVPGLFFAGLAGQRNFQSRYLRGIRQDMPVLAERLCQHLRSLPAPALPATTHEPAPAALVP